MYKLLLVQPGFSWGPPDLHSYYLPYSIGCLWAKCIENKSIIQNFDLLEMIALREDIDEVVARFDQIDVVGFSCYVWNYNYINELAKQIKKKFPKCLIVYGGPEPEHSDSNIFINKPWLDCVVVQEGELTFESILQSIIDKQPLEQISGLVVNKNQKRFVTENPKRISQLEEMPSPYIKGVFDELIKKYPDVMWTATLETNRGCPYKCTFCDWGSLTLSKIKKFLFHKVEKEIEWISCNKIDYVYVADANYGIFVQRDLEITKLFGKYKQKNGYPNVVSVNWTKNAKKSVLQIAEQFQQQGNPLGVSISLQSFHDDVLNAIERQNFEINNIEKMSTACHEKGIPVSVDLILGLPQENVTSWKQTYYKLFDLNIHQNFYTHHAMLLENTPMNKTQVQKFNIKKFKRPLKFNWENTKYTEFGNFVKSTNTLSHNAMIECAMHSNWMYALHHSGLSSEHAKFLKNFMSISYADFYNNLISDIITQDFITSCYQSSHDQLKKFYNDIEKVSIQNMELSLSGEFFILLYNIIQNNIERKIQQHISTYVYKKYNLDERLLKQLDNYSALSYLTYDSHTVFEKQICEFDYNFHEHNNKNINIEQSKVRYQFTKKLTEKFTNTIDYANHMVIRKRNVPSKNLITKIH